MGPLFGSRARLPTCEAVRASWHKGSHTMVTMGTRSSLQFSQTVRGVRPFSRGEALIGAKPAIDFAADCARHFHLKLTLAPWQASRLLSSLGPLTFLHHNASA